MIHNKAPIRSFLILFACVGVIYAPTATAQEMERAEDIRCATVAEEIITLKDPDFNTATIWSALYGEEGMERIADIIPSHGVDEDDKSFVIVGAYTKDQDDQIEKPFITKLDNRGRPVWENKEETNFNKRPHRVLKTATGYVVLGDIENDKGAQGGYLAFYTKDGKRAKQYPILEKGYALKVHDLAPSKTGKSYIITASRSGIDAADAESKKTEVVLYKITTEGKRLWRRQYSPGLSTALYNIQLAPDGNYTLTGEIEQANGRKAGWVMRVDDNGALMWQQPYPRGAMARLLDAHTHDDLSISVVGQVRGLREKNKSAWIMKLSANGDVLWQRYYQGRHHFNAPSMIGHDDGRLSVLMDGVVADRSNRSFDRGHVNLLTFSPRGYLMNLESFTDGQNAQGLMLKSGHIEERLIVGHAQSVMPDDMDAGKLSSYVFDGWVFAATALDPYDDPCEVIY